MHITTLQRHAAAPRAAARSPPCQRTPAVTFWPPRFCGNSLFPLSSGTSEAAAKSREAAEPLRRQIRASGEGSKHRRGFPELLGSRDPCLTYPRPTCGPAIHSSPCSLLPSWRFRNDHANSLSPSCLDAGRGIVAWGSWGLRDMGSWGRPSLCQLQAAALCPGARTPASEGCSLA